MKNKKENIANFIGTALIVVLIFFCISSFSNKSSFQTYGSSQFELKTELRSYQAAVILHVDQPVSVQKSCVSILFNANVNLFNEIYKISADNSKINQRVTLLQKKEYVIKPLLLSRFYFPLITADPEELPFLS